MNKEDLRKMEEKGLRGLSDYQNIVEFALDCITMKETDYAIKALNLLNSELKHDIESHGMVMVD